LKINASTAHGAIAKRTCRKESSDACECASTGMRGGRPHGMGVVQRQQQPQHGALNTRTTGPPGRRVAGWWSRHTHLVGRLVRLLLADHVHDPRRRRDVHELHHRVVNGVEGREEVQVARQEDEQVQLLRLERDACGRRRRRRGSAVSNASSSGTRCPLHWRPRRCPLATVGGPSTRVGSHEPAAVRFCLSRCIKKKNDARCVRSPMRRKMFILVAWPGGGLGTTTASRSAPLTTLPTPRGRPNRTARVERPNLLAIVGYNIRIERAACVDRSLTVDRQLRL
jgi:hypothetical protein